MAATRRLLDPKTFYFDFTPELVRRMEVRGYDGPEIAAVWARYLADRNQGDFQTLFNHYLEIPWCEARKAKRVAPTLFTGTLGECLSDGVLGLLQSIPRVKYFAPGGTRIVLAKAVRRSVWNEARSRSWGGRKRVEAMRTLQLIRAELTPKLGRVPTREEMTAALSERVKNPAVYFAYLDECPMVAATPRSQMEKEEDRAAIQYADMNVSDPSEKSIGDDVVHFAMKGMHGIDRKIFKLLLAGRSPTEIAKAVNLSRGSVLQRLNGVLWNARCRADLAACLGVEAADSIPKDRYRRPLNINKFPPARLVG